MTEKGGRDGWVSGPKCGVVNQGSLTTILLNRLRFCVALSVRSGPARSLSSNPEAGPACLSQSGQTAMSDAPAPVRPGRHAGKGHISKIPPPTGLFAAPPAKPEYYEEGGLRKIVPYQ